MNFFKNDGGGGGNDEQPEEKNFLSWCYLMPGMVDKGTKLKDWI